ncbi:ABC transporter permease [Pseudorhodobacter sp.]|uniref:ABC transporter permease n=1 Tax=Pseudorhodobacter sp. TaxID=1934400 RepID=UPI002647CF26|nr:ABC transporter permease [Pseudorhodobacter sp.]MDN5786802.1 ABC transporter permease [Pseudorhodobacter sp.]
MFQGIVNRILMVIPVIFGVTILSFLLLQVMPGDPAEMAMGTRASPEEIEVIRVQWGLDQPLWQQYALFVRDCLTGSFGTSLFHKLPVSQLILERLPYTLGLTLYSTVIALIIALPFAIVAALSRGRAIDVAIRQVFVLMLALPPFWLSFVFIIFFALNLGLFPTGGVGNGFLENIHRLFLPALVVGLSTAALIQQSLRGTLIETMGADFIDTARAKGLTATQVFRRHILRNSLISTISVIGVRISWVIGGTVVVEKIFSVPGLGSLLIDAILTRDFPVIRGLTVFFALLVVMVNLVTDIAYAMADPRVRLR